MPTPLVTPAPWPAVMARRVRLAAVAAWSGTRVEPAAWELATKPWPMVATAAPGAMAELAHPVVAVVMAD